MAVHSSQPSVTEPADLDADPERSSTSPQPRWLRLTLNSFVVIGGAVAAGFLIFLLVRLMVRGHADLLVAVVLASVASLAILAAIRTIARRRSRVR